MNEWNKTEYNRNLLVGESPPAVGKTPMGKTPVGKTPVGKTPVGKTPPLVESQCGIEIYSEDSDSAQRMWRGQCSA